ncbi:MAG TPA: enolase C-terminal domain-like protein [Burkholderiales bacterium]|nr:enolase C-terminal domain-like protein [Burkholderiales bacterium]
MSTPLARQRVPQLRERFAIERVEVFGVAVPLVGGGFKNAYLTKTVQKSAVVRITAGGAVGLGNIDPSPGYSAETIEQSLAALRERLAPAVIGLDAANVHVLNARLDAVTRGFLDAKAAIEMACVDLTARALGVPVYTYLGGAVKERLTFNAWIGILSPQEAAAEARKWFDRGFRSAKIKVGGGIEADRDRVKAVRDAVGGAMALRIDANAGYDADTAIRLAHLVRPCNLQLFEQPVAADDLAGMARVRREAGGVPVMADESVLDHASLIAVIKAGAADIVKLKVMKQGGFHRTASMLATAEAAGLRCVIGHGFGLGVNTVAEIMLAATSANVIDGLECVGPLKTVDDITTERLDLGAGAIALPPGPGLGVALDEGKLERYRFA